MQESTREQRAVDILLEQGTVIDPAQGIHTVCDVGIIGRRIVGVGRSLPRSRKTRVVNCRGLIVTPGLIDLHVHAYTGATDLSLDPDEMMLQGGVTTILDTGSAGYYTWAGFRSVAEAAQAEVLGLVNLCSTGLAAWRVGELVDPRMADVEKAVAVIQSEPTLAVGVKIRASARIIGEGEQGWRHLRMAKEAATLSDTWLMVHIGSCPMPVEELITVLEPDDVLTHCFAGGRHTNSILDANGKVFGPIMAAYEAGVAFDIGHGRGSFDWNVAERAMDQGLIPTTISTDLHIQNVNGPVFDMPTTMSKLLHLGMGLDDVIARSTWVPAQVLQREAEIGTLRPGSTADVALLRMVDGEVTLYDSYDKPRRATRRLEAVGVVRAGRIVKEPSNY